MDYIFNNYKICPICNNKNQVYMDYFVHLPYINIDCGTCCLHFSFYNPILLTVILTFIVDLFLLMIYIVFLIEMLCWLGVSFIFIFPILFIWAIINSPFFESYINKLILKKALKMMDKNQTIDRWHNNFENYQNISYEKIHQKLEEA